MTRRGRKFLSILFVFIFLLVTASPYTLPVDAATPTLYKYFGQEPTKAEKKLMRKHPFNARTVYKCSRKATELTIEYYGYNGRADNSDAFRHCLWTALIKQKLGKKKAKQWTTAHEGYVSKKNLEGQMDLKNNAVGLKVTTKKKNSAKTIAKRVKKKVENGECVRLNKKKTKLIKTNGDGLLL